jgi:hypothetical protein
MPQVRFGKHPAKSDYRTLRLENFLLSNLADPPQTFDTLPRVFTGTGIEDVPTLFPMDGNNQYGDCTIAALAHAITVFCGYQGKTNIPDEAMVVKLYLKLTNGVDSGLQELDVLNYWQSNEVDGDKISAYVRIAASNLKHVKQAIQLFGGVYLGFQVQENCVDEFNAGIPWTPGPLTNDGHAVYAVGYDERCHGPDLGFDPESDMGLVERVRRRGLRGPVRRSVGAGVRAGVRFGGAGHRAQSGGQLN